MIKRTLRGNFLLSPLLSYLVMVENWSWEPLQYSLSWNPLPASVDWDYFYLKVHNSIIHLSRDQKKSNWYGNKGRRELVISALRKIKLEDNTSIDLSRCLNFYCILLIVFKFFFRFWILYPFSMACCWWKFGSYLKKKKCYFQIYKLFLLIYWRL